MEVAHHGVDAEIHGAAVEVAEVLEAERQPAAEPHACGQPEARVHEVLEAGGLARTIDDGARDLQRRVRHGRGGHVHLELAAEVDLLEEQQHQLQRDSRSPPGSRWMSSTKSPTTRPRPTSMPAAACALACAPTATAEAGRGSAGTAPAGSPPPPRRRCPAPWPATNCASPASACASAEMPIVTLTPRLNSGLGGEVQGGARARGGPVVLGRRAGAEQGLVEVDPRHRAENLPSKRGPARPTMLHCQDETAPVY